MKTVFEIQDEISSLADTVALGKKAARKISNRLFEIHRIRLAQYFIVACPTPPSWGKLGHALDINFCDFDGLIITCKTRVTVNYHSTDEFNEEESPVFPIEWLAMHDTELIEMFKNEAVAIYDKENE